MVESLAPYFDDANEDTRRSAVQAIRLVHRTEVAAVVIRKLNDEAASVRSAALQVARNLDPSWALGLEAGF